MRVAVLGTGIMGAPMARNLAAAGHEVSAWNRSREKAEPLAEHGVTVAGSVAEAVAGADVVVTMLADARAVEAVAEEALGAMDGAVLAQMSTIGLARHRRAWPARADGGRRVRRRARAPAPGSRPRRASWSCSPPGRRPSASASTRSSTRSARRPCGWARRARAQRLKLVLNTWLLGLTEALAEAIALAEGLGVDPRTSSTTIDGAPVGAPYAQLKGPMMIDGEFPPAFPLALAAKDARLALEAAEAAGLRLGALAAVGEQMQRAVEAGHGERGHGGDDPRQPSRLSPWRAR